MEKHNDFFIYKHFFSDEGDDAFPGMLSDSDIVSKINRVCWFVCTVFLIHVGHHIEITAVTTYQLYPPMDSDTFISVSKFFFVSQYGSESF